MITENRSKKIVARWIFLGVAMLIVQVLLGGITRLTGSGLSITEWKPIMGALPPMTEIEWEHAFIKYQEIAQYKFLNRHFSLADFKFIFFWEWFHRLWARFIGVAFLIPFVYFLIKGYIRRSMINPLIILFLLGALQGVIGWIMVKSGLNDSDLYVSHIRLAVHFMAAMVLIAYALLFGLKLAVREEQRIYHPAALFGTIALTLLISVQLVFGAFMAGLKSAAVAPTWPLINGAFMPAEVFAKGWANSLLYDKITIHFVHRSLAYIIAATIILGWYFFKPFSTTLLRKVTNFALALVLTQLLLGVLTVLKSKEMIAGSFGAFEWLALCHQLTGMLLWLNLCVIVYLTARKKPTAV